MLKNSISLESLNIRDSSIGNQKLGNLVGVTFSPVTALLLGISMVIASAMPTLSLPPPEDLPEEVLRTEIITEARSPVDGEWLTAAEYAELEAELQRNPELYNSISPQIRHTIFLLQIRRAVRSIAPFLLP